MREFQIFAVCTSARGASPRAGPRLHSSGRRAPFADSVGKCIRGEDCLELVTSLKWVAGGLSMGLIRLTAEHDLFPGAAAVRGRSSIGMRCNRESCAPQRDGSNCYRDSLLHFSPIPASR